MRHCGEVVSCVSDKGYYYDSFGCAGCASYDLKVKTNDDGLAIVVPGEVLTYTIEVVNFGITAVAGARVLDPFPLQAVVWTCVGDGGASCTGSGSGDISDTVTLPVGGRVTYTATGTVPLVAAGTLSNTASVTAPQGVTDPDLGNNSITDVDVVGGPQEALGFFTLAPCRLVDTRGHNWPPLWAQHTRAFPVIDPYPYPYGAYCDTIPSDAKALSLNVAVTEPTSAGNVRLFPAGQCVPNVSTVNYQAGETRSSNAVVPLNASAEFSIFDGQPTGTVHLIIDVTGYFR